ncbi:transposase [Roseivivax marinus]|uniref:transposase n=1 Tax=Roseivivax marinus TaxID=1379903 RepID=UPI0035189D5F
MAAWSGLIPAEHSSGGKQTLLEISKRGNGYVRHLIIHGARSCFLHLHRETHALREPVSFHDARWTSDCTAGQGFSTYATYARDTLPDDSENAKLQCRWAPVSSH